ncbi:porin [Dechloromonas denitrificans]|uniref:porin n=1 Tax=Dechloromonas denitrificans TaxID=281362 RepID=UPI001CF803FE|nr:porin [Dechloromonas denitrificans]UCV11077.1 porin [Dechloromonas denitrificans]
MQKKIIALAVAGLASTAAFAQSNVTIYGSLDYGYGYRTDARKAAGANRGVADSSSRIDGGQSAGNRLGFKGTEDLGNGLKAVFLMEQGFNGDTGATPGNSNTAGASTNLGAATGFTRQAYVGLTGNFGTLIGGRLYTPHWSFVSSIDPFGAGTVGQFVNVYGGDVNALLQPVRVDNAVAYVSPNFGGFTLTGAYSNNAIGNENTADNSQNNTVYALLGQYANGPINVGLNYHLIQAASDGAAATVEATKSVQNITLGGTFDAKVVKIHALYSNNVVDQTAANADIKIDNYMVGLSAPIGKVTVKGSYMLSDGNYAAGGNAQQYAVGADYALSKRTNLYTAYSMIDNDSEVKNGVRITRGASVSDASNSGFTGTTAYQSGFQVGVRHQF